MQRIERAKCIEITTFNHIVFPLNIYAAFLRQGGVLGGVIDR